MEIDIVYSDIVLSKFQTEIHYLLLLYSFGK